MATAAPTLLSNPGPKVWTTEDLLAVPDDGIERWIIRGTLRAKPPEYPDLGVVVRNRYHSAAMAHIGANLVTWLRTRPHPRGAVFAEATVHYRAEPDSVAEVDLVYGSPELVES